MAGFDDDLKAAMDVRREQALAAVASDRKTKLLTRITPAEKIALMWAPYMKVEGGYVDGMTMTDPDSHHKVFRRMTEKPEGALAKRFADNLTLMQKLMQNINTAEVQLANLIKLNSEATGILDNAKLLMQKQAVRSSLDSNLKALAKAHRDLVSQRHRLANKIVTAKQSTPDGRVNFAVDYLIHQLSERVANMPAAEASLAMTSNEMMQSGITKLIDFNRAPAAVDQNARIKLDNFVSQLGSLKLTQNEESNPSYLRIVQTTNALRTAFDSELKANAKAISAHEKTFSKAVTKPKPNALTSKPTAFDVYLDTLFKANKMIALLEKKHDLVKSPAEVVAVNKELEQWREMRTQLKAAVQNNNNDNSVTFVNEQNPQGTVLQTVRDMGGDFRNNQQINAMLKLLASQMDHPNYKDNNKFPKLFAGNHNTNMPANWNALIEDPKLAAQHLQELQPEKPKSTKVAKSKKKADTYDAGITAQPAVARPSANQLLKERDQRNQDSLQGTQNNWNTCKAKMDELGIPKAFVNFVKMQFGLHHQDLETFLGDRNKLNDTKFIEAMNHRSQLLTSITATLEHPDVTPVIAINAIRGLSKIEFNRTPDSQQTAVFKAQLSTFVNSTDSIKAEPGSRPAMEKPPTLETPPPLAPRASQVGMFGAHSRPVTPAPARDASARMDANDLASDSSIRSNSSSSSRSDSTLSSSRSSTSSNSSDSTRSNNDQPPPPLEPPPSGPKGPGSRS